MGFVSAKIPTPSSAENWKPPKPRVSTTILAFSFQPSSFLHTRGLKGFSDGSLGSSTAWLFEPYEGSTNNFRLPADEMFAEGATRLSRRFGQHAALIW